jgi:diaminopropionate ammonia-lyase
MARLLNLQARIFVPHGTVPARIAAIATEGADVCVTDGGYDAAVARAAQEASDRCLVIADTAWEGYQAVPGWVIDGYATLFNEIDVALGHYGMVQPDVIAVQMGVGALAAAAVRHYRQAHRTHHATIIGVEPTEAACILDSLVAGQIMPLSGRQQSIMAGLNCGTPSPIAWPILAAGLDLCVAIEDGWAEVAVRELAHAGIIAGESGGAGLAGMLALANTQTFGALALTPTSHLLVIATEGATDPESYAKAICSPTDP